MKVKVFLDGVAFYSFAVWYQGDSSLVH